MQHYWRVFYTAPRVEKKCRDRLDRQEIDVFLPTRTVVRQWSDRKKKVVEPLFRSYIFANVDERDRLRVLRTDGIVRCVAFGGKIARVPDDDIERLKQYQQHPERLEAIGMPKPGTPVTINEGPMEGLSGEVVEHRGGHRLVVRIEAIRQAVSLVLPADWAEVAN